MENTAFKSRWTYPERQKAMSRARAEVDDGNYIGVIYGYEIKEFNGEKRVRVTAVIPTDDPAQPVTKAIHTYYLRDDQYQRDQIVKLFTITGCLDDVDNTESDWIMHDDSWEALICKPVMVFVSSYDYGGHHYSNIIKAFNRYTGNPEYAYQCVGLTEEKAEAFKEKHKNKKNAAESEPKEKPIQESEYVSEQQTVAEQPSVDERPKGTSQTIPAFYEIDESFGKIQDEARKLLGGRMHELAQLALQRGDIKPVEKPKKQENTEPEPDLFNMSEEEAEEYLPF